MVHVVDHGSFAPAHVLASAGSTIDDGSPDVAALLRSGVARHRPGVPAASPRSRGATGGTAMILALALLVPLQAPADDAYPILSSSRSTPGPDGNVAVEGVLRRRFCFSAPTSICVPAGSTVFYTARTARQRPGVTSTAEPSPPVLRWVSATEPITAFGLTFAPRRAPPRRPAQDPADRVVSLEVFGTHVKGMLADPLTFAGVVIGRGAVELELDGAGAVAGIATGALAADATAGPFTVPRGSVVSVCPDGIQHARAPRASAPGRAAIAAGEERHDEIAARREGDGQGQIAQVPWVCARKLLGWAPVAHAPAPAHEAP